MKAVILVGGEGRRLRPLTVTTPKPLLSLVNIPFLGHALKMLKRYGVEEVILATGYLPETFETHFGHGEKFGLKITYVTEKRPLDTCGAVKNVQNLLDDTFLVFNGDVLTGLNLASLIRHHQKNRAMATLSLTWVENPTGYGLVTFDDKGWVKGFLEKPSWDQVNSHWVNAGIYVLEPEILDYAPDAQKHSFERGLFPTLLQAKKPVLSFCSNDYWVDIGNPENYLMAHHNILYGKVPFDFEGEEIKTGVWVGEGTKVHPRATLFGPTVIGKGCEISSGATISSLCSIGRNCYIGEDTLVEESVILEGSEVGNLTVIKEGIIGEKVRVGQRVRVTEGAVVGDRTIIGDENHFAKSVKIWPQTNIEKRSIRF